MLSSTACNHYTEMMLDVVPDVDGVNRVGVGDVPPPLTLG